MPTGTVAIVVFVLVNGLLVGAASIKKARIRILIISALCLTSLVAVPILVIAGEIDDSVARQVREKEALVALMERWSSLSDEDFRKKVKDFVGGLNPDYQRSSLFYDN